MQRRNRSRLRTFFGSPFTLILAVVILVFAGKAALGMYEKSTEAAERLAEAQAALDRVAVKKASIAARIGSLSTEEGIEASIRTKYHVVEPGEQMAVIVSNEAAVVRVSTTSFAKGGPKGFWKSVLGIFGI